MSSPATKGLTIPPGYVPLKQWLADEAERRGLTPKAVEARMYRGVLPMPPVLRIGVGRRIKVVKVEAA